MGFPTLVQEQNSYAGLTNKMLAGHANTICVAYDGMERFFPEEKIVFTGNPVRADIELLSFLLLWLSATVPISPTGWMV